MSEDLELSGIPRSPGPAIIDITDLPGCKLAGVWAGMHNIVVHCRKEHDYEQAEDESQTRLYEVQWQSSQWNRVTRKLLNQSHRLFMSLQEEGRREEGEIKGEELVRFSKSYRSILHECVLGLREMILGTSLSSSEKETYTHQYELYSMLELAWHLCEVVFIEVLPAGCLVQQLLEWVTWHSGAQDEKALQDLLASPHPEKVPDYWRVVYRLVLKGQLNEARKLLSLHPFAHSKPHLYNSLDELLRKAPMVRPVGTQSRMELHRQWINWRSEVVHRKDEGNFITVPQLQFLMRILSGEEQAFTQLEIVSSCSHWYELMVGKLLFTMPLVVSTDYDLVYTAEGVIRLFPHQVGALDNILLASLKNDVMEVIKLSSSLVSDWWFVAHLTNLLHHKGLLAVSQQRHSSELPEFLLLEYASSLMGHRSLWQVAMDYFSQCSTHGRQYMMQYIVRVPLETERKAVKVLRVCQRYQLTESAQSICKVMAMRAYKCGRLGVAFSWCIRGKDSKFAGFLAEKYFENYKTLGEFKDLDLLDHLGDAILMSEKLMFLSKYREYHQLFEKCQFVEAGKLLVTLLKSNTVPKRFWPTLLTDVLQLMEGDELVFSTDQTYTLSHLIQELASSPPKADPGQCTHEGTVLIDKERIQLLRLAVSRNLCRAMLEESI